MSWNRYHENLLKKWSEISKTYNIMHSIAASWYASLDKKLGIPVIIIGAITSSSIFSSSSTSNYDMMRYINGTLALIVTALVGVNKFLGANDKQTKHLSASFKYTSIAMNIDTILSFQRVDRIHKPEEFINNMKKELLEIREHSPNLPSWIIKDYFNKLDKTLINTSTKVCKTIYIPNSNELPKSGSESNIKITIPELDRHKTTTGELGFGYGIDVVAQNSNSNNSNNNNSNGNSNNNSNNNSNKIQMRTLDKKDTMKAQLEDDIGDVHILKLSDKLKNKNTEGDDSDEEEKNN